MGIMRHKGIALFAALATLVALAAPAAVGAPAKPPGVQVNEVTRWNRIAVDTLVPGLPGPAGGAPPASQINMG
jgi:hypothetical protein